MPGAHTAGVLVRYTKTTCRDGRLEVIERLVQDRFVAPMLVARVHWQAGRVADALDWLERSVESREPNSPYLGILPEFESLRPEPRFQALLENIGLCGVMRLETPSGGPSEMGLSPTAFRQSGRIPMPGSRAATVQFAFAAGCHAMRAVARWPRRQ